MKKNQLVLAIIFLIALQSVTAYLIVSRIVAPRLAAFHAPPVATSAAAIALADTTAQTFPISVGIESGTPSLLDVRLQWTDQLARQAVANKAPQIEAALKQQMVSLKASEIDNGQQMSVLQGRLVGTVNGIIAPARISEITIRRQE